MNWCVLSGRAVDRPVLKQGKSKYFCQFTLAVKRPYRGKKIYNDRTTTDFFECIAFDGNAKNLRRHLPKGGMVMLAGNMETYFTESGKKKYIFNVAQVDLLHYRRADGTDTIKKLEAVEIDDTPSELVGMMSEHRANTRRKKYIDDIPSLNIDDDKLVGATDLDMPIGFFEDDIYGLSDSIPYEEEVANTNTVEEKEEDE